QKKGEINSIKICDFGIAITLGSFEENHEEAGTLSYLAPEILLHKNIDKKVDVWSLGILLYNLIAGYCPFDDDDNDKESKKIIYEVVTFDKKIFDNKSKNWVKLWDGCWEKNPENRLTIEEVIKSDWILEFN
ncbi:MAG: protein kinase domain-containing protein, partial [Mycoplasma sp.]